MAIRAPLKKITHQRRKNKQCTLITLNAISFSTKQHQFDDQRTLSLCWSIQSSNSNQGWN
jgi:hypothetical protein